MSAPKRKFEHPKKSIEERKQEKESRQKRKARIIIRNISYKSTEAKLREHFIKFGNILDVNVLKRSDGKLVGCAFIQYEKINQAAKAILQGTGKEFLGRTVHIDWAVNKEAYTKHLRKSQPTTPRPELENVQNEIKSEENSEDDADNGGEEDENENDIKEEHSDDDEEKDKSDGEYDEESEDKKDVKSKIKNESDEQKPRRISNDLTENCTVFIKNVPFDASANDFKKCCLQFGAIYYALINTDPVSGHSKGTGFVKYRV